MKSEKREKKNENRKMKTPSTTVRDDLSLKNSRNFAILAQGHSLAGGGTLFRGGLGPGLAIGSRLENIGCSCRVS